MHNINKKTIYFFIILTISLLLFSCSKTEKEIPKAESGIIDFSNWNFEEDGIATLNGEWEFYWEELLSPFNFQAEVMPSKTDYLTIPKLWNKYEIDNKKVGSNGYATFKLRIKLPQKDTLYTLKFNRIETAYKLWIDNTLITEVGKVGVS